MPNCNACTEFYEEKKNPITRVWSTLCPTCEKESRSAAYDFLAPVEGVSSEVTTWEDWEFFSGTYHKQEDDDGLGLEDPTKRFFRVRGDTFKRFKAFRLEGHSQTQAFEMAKGRFRGDLTEIQ